MSSREITTRIEIENKKFKYTAFVHKITKNGKIIMIYETDKSPVVARNKLSRLLGL